MGLYKKVRKLEAPQKLLEGGVLQAREPRKKAKYTGDGARYGFGVMMKRDKHGELERNNNRRIDRYAFFYDVYRPSCWWWE